MYESPIKVYETQIEMAKENEIFKAINKIGVTVDKYELIKALEYDRGQYSKGFEDGKEAACEWISVKDRLPEKEQEVLCYCGEFIGDLINVYTYMGNDKWEDDYGYFGSTKEEGISYWMPLPSLPNAEE